MANSRRYDRFVSSSKSVERMTSIATSSIEEGLDFGFNLLIGSAAEAGKARPELATRLLMANQNFVHPRYAGESEIALQFLEELAELIPDESRHNLAQVELQLEWLREQFRPRS